MQNRIMAVVFAAVMASSMVVASSKVDAAPRVSVFAELPAPGHGTGVAVHKGRVYVSTGAGQPARFNTEGERIFTFDAKGRLLDTRFYDTGPVSNMGLGEMAFDGHDRLYVADMNGMVVRYDVDGTAETWAMSPLPYSAGSWTTSMWNSVIFDARGNGYVLDGGGRIWRVSPKGELTEWFSDPRLQELGGSGMFQGTFDARGEWIYFASVVDMFPDRAFSGGVYRVRVKEKPGADDLEQLHRFPMTERDVVALPQAFPYMGAEPNGIAIGRSGRIYVTVSGHNEIAVLAPDGRLLETIESPLFDYPVGLAFHGDRLLTTNMNIHEKIPENWNVLSVDVNDTGIEPFRPRNVA